MNIDERSSNNSSAALIGFLSAPVRPRTYANLLYLSLAFPLGLGYFILLVTGLSLGIGLTIVWVGLAILALVFAISWGLMAFERQLAIHLLGAEIPPMAPPAMPAISADAPRRGFWASLGAHLSNPVTWKGLGYLLVKFPLGVVSFVLLVTLLSVTGAFLMAPFLYEWGTMDVGLFYVDTLGEALACSAFGVVLLFVSLNLLNGLAFVCRQIATLMLGSERFAAPAPPAPPLALEPAAAV